MVPKDFLMFITVYSVVVARSELLGHQSTCHFQIIHCSCKEMYGVDLIVTVEKCVYDLKEGDAKSVCSSETVMEKCRKGDTFSLHRQRRAGFLNLCCKNGTILPTVWLPTKTGPPKVTMISGGSQIVVRDDSYVKFQCKVVSNLAANVTWLLNGLPLTGQMDFRYSYLECRTVLLIENVLSTDAGNYTCLVQNEKGQAMASSYLTVRTKDKGPMYIMDFGLEGKTGMQGVAVTGTSVNLTCRTQNTAVVNYFLKDGSPKIEDGIRVTWYQMGDFEHNIKVAKLEIKNLTLADSGNYSCISVLHGITKRKTFPLRIAPYPPPTM